MTVDLLARLLLSPGEAAVDDGLVQGLQTIQGIGPMSCRLAQVLEQTRVGGAEGVLVVVAQPGTEILAQQRVGIDLLMRIRHHDQPQLLQATKEPVPIRLGQTTQRCGQAIERVGARFAKHVDQIPSCRPVEQAEQP